MQITQYNTSLISLSSSKLATHTHVCVCVCVCVFDIKTSTHFFLNSLYSLSLYLFLVLLRFSTIHIFVENVSVWKIWLKGTKVLIESGVCVLICFEKIVHCCLSFFLETILIQILLSLDIICLRNFLG